MAKPRFDPTSEPDVVVAFECPRSMREEMRRWAAERSQTLEAWIVDNLRAGLDYERDEHQAQQRPAAKAGQARR